MQKLSADGNWRALHGGVLLAFLVVRSFLANLASWPWLWLAPLIAYFVVVAIIPPLRRTFAWARIGRVDRRSGATAIGIAVVASATLIGYHAFFAPDVNGLGAAIPVAELGGVATTGIVFVLLNAIMEELVFRAILFDAIDAEWGKTMAVIATSAVFGFCHLYGYPPGSVGAVLAGVFGLAMALLRTWTAGLGLAILVHIAADATIYGILVYSHAV